MRKTKHWLMTIAALLCSLAVSGHDFEVDGIYYNITSSEGELTVSVTYRGNSSGQYKEYSGKIIIPSMVTYHGDMYTVKYIGVSAFSACWGLTSVTLPESVMSIGDGAFRECSSLTSITLPEGVAGIAPYTFYDCINLVSINIPTSVRWIASSAFYNCESLSSITFPEELTEIGGSAFYKCRSLTSITSKAVTPPTISNSYNFNGVKSIPVYVPQKSIGAYQQADVWKEFTNYQPLVTVIASGTCGDNLTWKLTDEGELTIEGEGEMKSSPWSEYESSIKSVVIGEGVTSINSYAFFNCTNLTSIDIPESVCKIGQYAFANTGWYDNQPEGLVYIGSCLYGYKGEMPENFELVVKEGTKGIADYAFESSSNLIMATIPESVSYIGRAAFMQSELGLVLMSEGVKSIGGGAFWGCYRLEEVSIPESVTEVGSEAFHNTAWYRKQPCGMLYLSGWALGSKNCWECEVCQKMNSQMSILEGTKGLASGCIPDGALSVIIPESVVYLSYEFAYGYRESIICKALVPPSGVNESTFNYITDNAVLYVPASAVNAYKADEHWGKFVNIQAIDFPVWTLTSEGELIVEGTGAMEDYGVECTPWAIYDEFIKSVTIKEGVTSVGNNAFAYCEKIESASLPNSLTSIGVGAFAECDNLKSIVIPENVTILGNAAFYGCGISQITCNAMTPPTIAEETFFYISKSIPVYVPLNSVSSYRNASYWNEFTNIQAMPEHVTINQYGSGTYCSEYALDFSEVEGLKAYVAAGYDSETGVVTLLRVMTANAGVGLFVKGEPGDYVVPTLESTSYNALNMLVGTLEETTVNSTDGSYTNYKYTIREGDAEPKFYPFADASTQAAGRAYLQIPTAWLPAAEQKSISIRFDEGEGTTDIENTEFTIQNSALIYDLMGRRVANPTKGGIYIVNGKKVIR